MAQKQSSMKPDESARTEAAYWLARMGAEDISDADFQKFEDWLDDREANSLAYEQAQLEWNAMDAPALAAEFSGDLRPKASASTSTLSKGFTALWQSLTRPAFAGAAVMAAACIVAAVIILPKTPEAKHFTTAPGEIRTTHLADGSMIDLNGNTQLSVSYASDNRTVTFTGGEALFTVKKDENRPFIIQMGDQHIEVLGTSFNVFKSPKMTEITVRDGRIALSSAQGTTQLTEGEQYVRAGTAGPVFRKGLSASTVASWKNGRIVANNIPFAEFIARLDRYFDGRILVEDTSLNSLMVTASLNITDPARAVKQLPNLLPIQLTPLDNGDIRLSSGISP